MIPSEDLNAQSSRARFPHRLPGSLSKRIVEGDQAEDVEIGVESFFVFERREVERALGDGEHSQPARRPGIGHLFEPAPLRFRCACTIEQHLRRTLREGSDTAVLFIYERHPLPIRIERKLADDGAAAPAGAPVRSRAREPSSRIAPSTGSPATWICAVLF